MQFPAEGAQQIVMSQAVETEPSVRASDGEGSFVLQFRSIYHAGRDFAFPCDRHGNVDLDAMSQRIRNNYLYARAMVGRELLWPTVCRLS
jgi:hypothetical protein